MGYITSSDCQSKGYRICFEKYKIDTNEHDYFIGIYSVNRLIRETTFDKWRNETFDNIIPEIKEKNDSFNKSGAIAIWPDFDHVIPDWDSIMTLGFSGLLKRAEKYHKAHELDGSLTPKMSAHFQGIEIQYRAIIDFVKRLYDYASTKQFPKAQRIKTCLGHLIEGAPTDFYEALQLIYIYFMISESVDFYQVRSLGNGLDSTLYSFYIKDLNSGRYTQDEIKEFLAYFFMQWSAIGNYWGQPFYLGGTNKDGSTKINQLSYDIINVYFDLGIYNPKIQIKFNSNTPKDFIQIILKNTRKSNGNVVFCCEPAMVKAAMGYGATYDEALNLDISGCYETRVRANEVSTSTGYVNAPKALLYVLSNGFDNTINKQIGIHTGELSEFKTFDDFYFAVIKQWEYLIEESIRCANQFEKYFEYINPSLMYSATIEDSLKKGLDAYQCGVKFNNSAMLNCGFATLVDSIMAVKEFVYDKKEVTLKELKNILDNNWENNEILRSKIINSPHKYGNGDFEADKYAEMLSQWFCTKVNNRPNSRGGIYKAQLHSAMQFVFQGNKTGATPDGRKSGEEVSKNGSPSIGADKEGVTALINSMIGIKPYLYCESACLDVMLHSSAVEGDDGIDAMYILLENYMNRLGMSIQFNVFNAETLKDAQKNPKKYENLQVRVCGWNVLWNNLSKKEQDAYIKRAENII